MANPSEVVLQKGLLYGKLPGMKEQASDSAFHKRSRDITWQQYYMEVTPTHMHILEGGKGDPTRGRKHLRSLEIDRSDLCGEDTKFKKEFRFYVLRSDGKYTFKCDSQEQRTQWITQIQRVIHKQYFQGIDGFESPNSDTFSPSNLSPPPSTPKQFEVPQVPNQGRRTPQRVKSFGKRSVLDTALPRTPIHATMNSPRSSVISTDSGFGASEGGEVKRHGLSAAKQHGYRSAPTSGDGKFLRSTATMPDSKSDGGRVRVQVQEEGSGMNYSKCKWYWDTTNRQEAERRLLAEGKIGNFIVRINASGHYVMTYWRKDGIHHHKILNHGNIFCFEKSAVDAEGESLVDLLDTYMKLNNSKDKPIDPFGGVLYENYNYAWTPPEFDMNLLEERLKEQKRLRQEATKVSGRPGQYTPVDLKPDPTSKEDSGSGTYDSEGSVKESPARVRKSKPLPDPPAKKRHSEDSKKTFATSTEAEPVSEHRQPTKAKPPAPVNPKPRKRSGHPESSKQVGGAAFLQELQRKTKQSPTSPDQESHSGNPTPRTKPKPTSKSTSHALKASEQPSSTITDSYEPPVYANTNFDNKHRNTESLVSSGRVASEGASGSTNTTTASIDPESIYMNLHPAPVAPRRKAGARAAPPQTEYQNIGNRVRRKH